MRRSPWRTCSTGSRRAAGGCGKVEREGSDVRLGVATLASGCMCKWSFGARGEGEPREVNAFDGYTSGSWRWTKVGEAGIARTRETETKRRGSGGSGKITN